MTLTPPGLTQVEKDKLAIDPDFDFREDIAARPFQDLTTNEIGMFKWTGIYHQLQKGFFMIRLRMPGGLLTADQFERAGDLAERYGQSDLCITTRQCLQFHWIRKEDLHKVLEGMAETGIDSRNACGDVNRNVVTCPLAGVCRYEQGDTLGMVQRLADDPEILNDQRNLPRKHKMSVSGCGRACGQTLMNDQGWYPVTRPGPDGGEESGWRYHAGGGLGARPFLARTIFDWVPDDLVVPVTRAALEAFRRLGNRRLRPQARLKIVVETMGPQAFGAYLLGILRERGQEGVDRIVTAREDAELGEYPLDGEVVVPQKQPGLNTVRLMILRSELFTPQVRKIADWARRYGDGTLILTNRQNLQLRNVPDANVEPLMKEIGESDLVTDGLDRLPDMVACVGTTQCNLAVSDTPATYRKLYEDLGADREWWRKVGPLRIHMNGCPNSCAQHWIADIGLRGTRYERPEGSEEGFSVFVGGRLSGNGHLAEYVCDAPAVQIPAVLRRMLDVYLEQRTDPSEPFGAFARRLGGEALAQAMGEITVRPEGEVAVRNVRLKGVFEEAVREGSGGKSVQGSGFRVQDGRPPAAG